MNTHVSKIITLTGLAGLLAGLNGCSWFKPSPNAPLQIVVQPQSQLVEDGHPARFTVVAVPEPLLYQWQFNGVNIPEATGPTYEISQARVRNVGEYQVLIRKPGKERGGVVSEKAYLSVYSLMRVLGGGTSGSITAPIDSFQADTDPTFCTMSFDKVCKYTPFDGPHVTPHSAQFPNSSNYPLLTIATTGNDPALNTGIAIQQNSLPPPAPVTACGNNNTTTATATLANNFTYRVGIYCKKPAVAENITWTWLYHQ